MSKVYERVKLRRTITTKPRTSPFKSYKANKPESKVRWSKES